MGSSGMLIVPPVKSINLTKTARYSIIFPALAGFQRGLPLRIDSYEEEKMQIEFDCREAQHEESSKYPSHRCWGWFKTHTYEFTEPVTVAQITGEINMGISESSKFFPVEIQLSEDKANWVSVGETGAIGEEGYKPFSVVVNNILAKYLRFYATEGFVDGSRGTVYVASPIGEGCVGNIIWDQSIFYEGPFKPGASGQLVAKVAMINNGDEYGRITCDLYEYPGDPVKEKLLDHYRAGYEPGSTGAVYFREDTPNTPGTWPLGVKVWCNEPELSLGSMGTFMGE